MSTMKIPIIFYHAIVPEKGHDTQKYSVGVRQFTEQVDYLAKAGFKGVLMDEIFTGGKPDAKQVAVTFDDGAYSDFSIAAPILEKYGITATFFVTVNYVGKQGYVSWGDLRRMSGMGMSIQSHSLNHVFLSDLDDRSLTRELAGSKRLLEENVGTPVHYISLPGGFCSRKVLEAARECGYRGVCTSVPGYNAPGRGEFLVLKRMLVTRKTSLEDFATSVEGNFRRALSSSALYLLKAAARKTLGSRAYYSLWSKLFKEVK